MKNLETDNLTKECTGSIRKALAHLSHRERQRQLFITAFTSGDASKFQNTEHDRWIFNALACINAAGEQNFHASPIPLSFCALMDEEFEGTAYGICIPTSCLNEKYKILSSWKTVSLFNDGTKKEKPFEICLSSRHKEQWYQQWKPILVFCFLLLFPCLIIISSTNQNNQFGYKNVSPFYQQILQAFSLKENLKLLAHVSKEPNSTITCIVGLRVLAAFWAVLVHTTLLIQPFFENLEEYEDDMVNGFWNQALTNNTLAVDIFFVISGTLTSFNWFKSKGNTQQQTWSSAKYWLKFYRHREWDWTLYHLLYGAVFRNLFAISIALLIYNCYVSESDPFNKILSLKLWMPLSSISYSIYLVHVVPITFTFLLDQFPMTYTDKWHIAFHYLVQLSLSIAIGFIVTMSVEIPFRNLERIFSKKKIHHE
uniref:Acyltransferase 3 domain-containing protein n=1 Tax=Acrobeloides nanus TaxID=290746 RepID=A0A914D4P7_9BILA